MNFLLVINFYKAIFNIGISTFFLSACYKSSQEKLRQLSIYPKSAEIAVSRDVVTQTETCLAPWRSLSGLKYGGALLARQVNAPQKIWDID